MEADKEPIQFDEFITNAAAILEGMEVGGKGVLIEWRGKVYTIRPKSRRNRHKHAQFTEEDSIFKLAGAGRSAEPTDIAKHKHDYLAEAAADLHQHE